MQAPARTNTNYSNTPCTSVCPAHNHATTYYVHTALLKMFVYQHTSTTCLKTCVTFTRHLDSWDQRQWYIFSSCMDREKTRQGDSTLIDIRTFVRHLSVCILGVRDEYHQIYILRRKNGSKLMADVFDVEESPQLNCFCGVFVAMLSQKKY